MIHYYDSSEFNREKPHTLPECEFMECHFKGVNLTEENLNSSKIFESHFHSCNLSNVNLTNVTMRDVTFKDCKMVGINWSSAQGLSDLVFENCILDLCIFQELLLIGTSFKNWSIKEVDFSGSKLQKSIFSGSKLTGTIFTDSNLERADLRNAIDYFIDPNYTKIKKAQFSMPEAMVLLNSFDIILE